MNARRPTRAEQEQAQREQERQRRKERRLLGMVAVIIVVVVIGGGILLQLWRTNRAPSAVPLSEVTSTPLTITNGQPLVFGNAAAPVRITVYEDFHCPHCVNFEEELGATIRAAQSTGQAAVELYPMAFVNAGSTAAANAMACAAESGFGDGYHVGLFANSTLQWTDRQLIGLAAEVNGTAPAGFAPCVTERRHLPWVESINATAAANGVTSTPTVFIDGTPVELGRLTPDTLKAMIDKASQS